MGHHYMEGVEVESILPAQTKFDGIPYVGCAATIPVGSDSYPATVVEVSEKTVEYETSDGKIFNLPAQVALQQCMFRRTDKNGLSEIQTYVYYNKLTPFDEKIWYSWRASRNNYVAVGMRADSSGAQSPIFGVRRAYWDPSF